MDRLAATSMCAGSPLCVKDMQTRLLAEVQPFQFQQAVQSMTVMNPCSQIDIHTKKPMLCSQNSICTHINRRFA